MKILLSTTILTALLSYFGLVKIEDHKIKASVAVYIAECINNGDIVLNNEK